MEPTRTIYDPGAEEYGRTQRNPYAVAETTCFDDGDEDDSRERPDWSPSGCPYNERGEYLPRSRRR